jgi:hypothetical protein
MQTFRHFVHLLIAFFTDSFRLVKALFYQLQRQHFKKEVKKEIQEHELVILANGPSLATVMDRFCEIKNADFCMVNLSPLTDIFWELKPKLLVTTDMSLYVHKDKDFSKNFRSKLQEVNWALEYCVPFHYPNWIIKEFKRNPFIKVSRYTTEPWSPELGFFKKLRFRLYEKGVLAPNCSNVLIATIYVSILKGYKQMFLFGADHSWIKDVYVNDKNQVVHADKHYYGTEEHVWLDYQGNPIKLADLLESNLSTFRNHQILRDFADYLGDVRIINCTEGSYIDAYERGKLEVLLKDN